MSMADIQQRTAACTGQLAANGYAVVRGLVRTGEVEAIDADLAPHFARTPFCKGDFYGETTKRFGRLLVRSSRMADLVRHPMILSIAEAVLSPWCDRFQLNVAQAIAVHPGASQQMPHRDQDMWAADIGHREYLLNIIFPLTPFEARNGATMVWPGSHGQAALREVPERDPVAIEMMPGDALLFLGSTLHGAGANRSDQVRRAIVTGYSLGWLKSYENQLLAYPPDVARHFPRELAALVGYAQHRPNLGNYEGQCPSVLLDGAPDPYLPAIDALRPDQVRQVAAFAKASAAS